MIIKPLRNSGKGSPKAVMRYLLDKPDGQVTVLKGEPNLSQAIAESLSYQHKYEAWVLSFEEAELSHDVKMAIINEFEKTFLPYFQDDKSRYNITWIEHSDKGRVELNLFMPKVDLATEKQISLFNKSRQNDWALMNNFRDYINARFELSDPLAQEKMQATKLPDWLLKAKSGKALKRKEFQEGINKFIENAVSKGTLLNRDDVITVLDRAYGVSRVGRDSISIKNPDGGQNIKLKGALYSEQFTSLNGLNEFARTRERTRTLTSDQGNTGTIQNTTEFRSRDASYTSGNSLKNDCERFKAELDRNIEYRRKTQQRAYGEHSGRGKAFKGIENDNLRHDHHDREPFKHGKSGFNHDNTGTESAFRRVEENSGLEYDSRANQSELSGLRQSQSASERELTAEWESLEIPIYRSSRAVSRRGSDVLNESAENSREMGADERYSNDNGAEVRHNGSGIKNSESHARASSIERNEEIEATERRNTAEAEVLRTAFNEHRSLDDTRELHRNSQSISTEIETLSGRSEFSLYDQRSGAGSKNNNHEKSGECNITGTRALDYERDVRSTLESYPRGSREYFAELRKDLDYIADRAEQYNHIDRESQPNGNNTNHARANTERIRNIVEIARDAKERSTIRDELNRLSERGSEFISEFRSRVQGIVQYIWDRAERAERERLEAERARVQPVQPKPNAPKFRM